MNTLACVVLLMAMCFSFVSAWGAEGHRITAMVAQEFFTENTVTMLKKLLGMSNLYESTPSYTRGIINWPDDYDHTARGAWSYDLHFVYTHGFPFFAYQCDCRFQCDPTLARMNYCKLNETLLDCCVVAGIEKYQDEIWLEVVGGQSNMTAGTGNTNNVTEKIVLLAHWIGDVHEPMHVDSVSSLNGNQYHIKWMGNSTCGRPPYVGPCQLHEVWDSLMIQLRLQDYGPPPNSSSSPPPFDPREMAFTQHLLRKFSLLNLTDPTGLFAREWATASVDLSAMAYLVDPGFDVDMHYYESALPIVEMQLFLAGIRMARSLNYAFSSPSCSECRWWQPLCRPTGNLPLPPECTVGNSTSTKRRK